MTEVLFAAINTRYSFVHCWPDAPEVVAFLRYPHRHEFHVKVQIEQFHSQRDVEYLIFKAWLDERIKLLKTTWKAESSCETMAQSILSAIRDTYGLDRSLVVQVLEDGENGARVFSLVEPKH